MKRTLVCCHPYDKSLNAAIKSVIVDAHKKTGVELKIYDLYESKFDPVLSQKELREFSRARTEDGIKVENLDPMAVEMAQEINDSDELILLFPIWWELMPAQMKGFIDKVIFPGLFYTNVSELKMKSISDRLKKVTVITTMNTPNIIYRMVYGSCINFALKFGTFRKIGVKKYRWVSLSSIKFKSEEKRHEYLNQIAKVFSTSGRQDQASTPAAN